MKEEYKRIEARFGPEASFELRPISVTPFRAVLADRFEALRTELLVDYLKRLWDPKLNSEVRRAANEAAALAHLTAYPVLVYPILFEEKVKEAVQEYTAPKRVREGACELIAL